MLQNYVNHVYKNVEVSEEELGMLKEGVPTYYLNDLNNEFVYTMAYAIVGVQYDGNNKICRELGNPVLYTSKQGFCVDYLSELENPESYEILFVHKAINFCDEKVFHDHFGIQMYEVGLRTKR